MSYKLMACQNSWMLKLILKCAWLQLYISVVSSLMPLFQKPLLLHFYRILLCSYWAIYLPRFHLNKSPFFFPSLFYTNSQTKEGFQLAICLGVKQISLHLNFHISTIPLLSVNHSFLPKPSPKTWIKEKNTTFIKS